MSVQKIDLGMLKKTLEKDMNGSEKVEFNYPKYEAVGTPHDIWLSAVESVETYLNSLIQTQPFPEDYPIAHLRNEIKDEQGKVTKVVLEVFGKVTLAKFALMNLRPAEEKYVFVNMINSSKKDEILQNFSEEEKKLLNAEFIHVSKMQDAHAAIKSHLESKGIDSSKVKVVDVKAPEAISGKEKTPFDKQLDDLLNMPFVMPKNDSDDYN
jgi:hypothetical protein